MGPCISNLMEQIIFADQEMVGVRDNVGKPQYIIMLRMIFSKVSQRVDL